MPLVSSGVEHGNLRELALARMHDLGTQCRDVRTREVGIQEIHNKVRPYEVNTQTLNSNIFFIADKCGVACLCSGILSILLPVCRHCFTTAKLLSFIFDFRNV